MESFGVYVPGPDFKYRTWDHATPNSGHQRPVLSVYSFPTPRYSCSGRPGEPGPGWGLSFVLVSLGSGIPWASPFVQRTDEKGPFLVLKTWGSIYRFFGICMEGLGYSFSLPTELIKICRASAFAFHCLMEYLGLGSSESRFGVTIHRVDRVDHVDRTVPWCQVWTAAVWACEAWECARMMDVCVAPLFLHVSSYVTYQDPTPRGA